MSARGQEGRVVRQSLLSGGTATIAVGSGLVLDVVAAAVFGAGRDTDAFVVAARLPLALTAVLMIIGNQVLVASYAAWSVTLDERRQRRLTTSVLLGAVAVGSLVAVALSAAAPYLVVALGPGFDAAQHDVAAGLLRTMAWMVPMIAGCEALRAWLNARHRFVVPAAMTVVLNVVAVAVVLLGTREIEVLPRAYVTGAAVQLVLMLGYAVAVGWRPGRPVVRDPEARRLVRLLVRPTAAAGLNPITRAAETVVASFLPPGSATVLHYGQRAVSAVGGTVLFRSVMLAVLPRLTRAHVTGDPAARRIADLGLQLMVVVSFPLTALTVVLALPGAEAMFGVGRFDPHDAHLLGVVLTVLALSFPLSAVQRALLAPFYAARDTRVPLHNTVVGVVVNLLLLGGCLRLDADGDRAVVAVAAAYVVANVANVLHARRAVGRSGLGVPRAGWPVLLRSTLSALATAGAAGLVWWGTDLPTTLRLALAAAAGLVAAAAVELPGRVSAPTRVRHRSPRTLSRLLLLTTLALLTSAAATLSGLSYAGGRGLLVTLLPLGLLAGVALLSLALARMEVFVLALLVSRTSMDAFQVHSGTSAAEPAALVGMLFLGTGAFWLAAQWREDGAIRLSRLGTAVVLFSGAALIGVLVAPTPWIALVEWVRLTSVCTMVLVIERLARTPGFRERLVAAVAGAAVVPLVVGAWQLSSGTGLFDAGGFARVRGTFTHSNPMAAFLAIVVVMAVAYVVHLTDLRYRLAALAVALVASAGLYTTFTRAAWLAAVLGIAVVMGTRGRRWLLGLAAGVLVLGLALPGAAARFSDLGDEQSSRGEPSNSLTWRAGYWGEALLLSEESPVTGIGLKQVVEESSEGKQPHNDYLRAYVEMGVLGLLAFGWLMIQQLATGIRAMRATAHGSPRDHAFAVGFCGVAAGYLLMSLVANLMSQVVVGIYFAALAGAASALLPAPSPGSSSTPAPVERRRLEEVRS